MNITLAYILFIISIASFSWMVAFSELSFKFKVIFSIDKIRYMPLLHISTWKKALGSYFYYLLPFILLIIIGLQVHKFFHELFSCPYCISFWLMFIGNYWIFHFSFIHSLILSGLAFPVIKLYDYITNHI